MDATELTTAVKSALQTNPDVGIVAENKRAVEYEREQAEAGYYPSVDVSTSTGYELTDDRSTRNRSKAGGDADHVRMPRWESSVTVSQPLFDGFATDAEVSRQESRVVSAARRVRETSEFVGLDAIEAYLESLR